MNYRWIAVILSLILFFVLTKTEFRYRFGNDPALVPAYLPYSAQVALFGFPGQRLSRPSDAVVRS